MALPSGVLTFVFSDIEGSMKLWESDPTGMRVSLARHDEIVRSVVEGANGTAFKHTGDGFGAVFASVAAGLEAAAAVAAALANHTWEGPALNARIGVHSGEAEPTGDRGIRHLVIHPLNGLIRVEGSPEGFILKARRIGRPELAVHCSASLDTYCDLGEGIQQSLIGTCLVPGVGEARGKPWSRIPNFGHYPDRRIITTVMG